MHNFEDHSEFFLLVKQEMHLADIKSLWVDFRHKTKYYLDNSRTLSKVS